MLTSEMLIWNIVKLQVYACGRVFKQLFVHCALFCLCVRIVLPDEGPGTETLQKKKGYIAESSEHC